MQRIINTESRAKTAAAAWVFLIQFEVHRRSLNEDLEKHLEIFDAAPPGSGEALMEPDTPHCMLRPCPVVVGDAVIQALFVCQAAAIGLLDLRDTAVVANVS